MGVYSKNFYRFKFCTSPNTPYESLLTVYNEYIKTSPSIRDCQDIFLSILNPETKIRIYTKWIRDNLSDSKWRGAFHPINLQEACRLVKDFLKKHENIEEEFRKDLEAFLNEVNFYIPESFKIGVGLNIDVKNIGKTILSELSVTTIIKNFNDWDNSPELQEFLLVECIKKNSVAVKTQSKKLWIYGQILNKNFSTEIFDFSDYETDKSNYQLMSQLTKADLILWASQAVGCTEEILNAFIVGLGPENNSDYYSIIKEELKGNYYPLDTHSLESLNSLGPITKTVLAVPPSFWFYNGKWHVERNDIDISYSEYLCFLQASLGDNVFTIEGEVVSSTVINDRLKNINLVQDDFDRMSPPKNVLDYILSLKGPEELTDTEVHLLYKCNYSPLMLYNAKDFLTSHLPSALKSSEYDLSNPEEVLQLFNTIAKDEDFVEMSSEMENLPTFTTFAEAIKSVRPDIKKFVDEFFNLKNKSYNNPPKTATFLTSSVLPGALFQLEGKTMYADAEDANNLLVLYFAINEGKK